MSVARNAAEVLNAHTTLALECIDRMYLNVYVPILQTGAGTSYFFRKIRGNPVPSSALMAPMTRGFVRAIERYAEQQAIDVVHFTPSFSIMSRWTVLFLDLSFAPGVGLPRDQCQILSLR